MTDYQKYINALRKCATEHENDRTFTGHIIVSDLCRDTANLLEELEQEPKKSYWIEHDTYYDCSLCGCVAPCTEMADNFLWKLSNYCPDCGAKMENQMYRRNRKRG